MFTQKEQRSVENLAVTIPDNDPCEASITSLLGLEKEENQLKDMQNSYASNPPTCRDEKLEKLEKLYLKSENLRKIMKKRYKAKYRVMKNNLDKMKKIFQDKNFEKMFNQDQKDIISGRYKKCPLWCDKTLVTGFKLKFACGNSGYKELIKHGLPLPSIRTLQRQLENWEFKSGIIPEAFEFLSIKVPLFRDNIYKDSLLIIDEVNITPGKVFDCSSKSYVGFVTLGSNDDTTELADHCLVFMLAGISCRWKQPVAYYYTNKSTNGRHYYQVVTNIIQKAENIGLKVHGIVSDMGSANQAMWSMFGIHASRYTPISNKCIHPFDTSRYLYFFHDTAHAFKNFKEGMLSNKIITIPDKYVQKFKLPNNQANAYHFNDLIKMQDNNELLLAHKLKDEQVSGKRHFRKMRVANTSNVVSHEVGTAFEFVADEINKPQYKTTAWLINVFNRWWNICGCRNLQLAISKKNDTEYKSTKSFLKGFIDLVSSMQVGVNSSWKPLQTGLIITTKSIIELSDYLLNNHNYEFVMAGRFSQDCLENIFSSLRVRNPVLNALQVKNNLKLVTVSSYMKDTTTSSYNKDDREILPEFLKVVRKKKQSNTNRNIIIPDLPIVRIKLSKIDLNILHNIAGYLIMSIAKNQKVCKKCIPCTGSFKASIAAYSKLTSLRCYKEDTLFFVNRLTFNFFVEMEYIFRTYFNTVHSKTGLDLKLFFVDKFSKINYNLPDCHKLKKSIMSRYASFRLKIKSQKLKKIQSFSSKTMHMHYNTV